MAPVNPTDREITCKIVYYGPAGSGKTTNLRYLYECTPATRRGRTIRLAGPGDRKHGFDLLPLELGAVAGFTTRFQLYSVPGASHFQATRRLVLEGADGIVFVADSQARQLHENIVSLQNLQSDLLARNVDVRVMPMVFQYNKQDLPRDLLLSAAELDGRLNYRSMPSVAAQAVTGLGVFDTLKAVSEMILDKLAYERPSPTWT